MNTPSKRVLESAEAIFGLLGLTPDNHKIPGTFSNVGEFLDNGGDIERVAKRQRTTYAQPCVACEPTHVPDVTLLPEYQILQSRVPPAPAMPEFSFEFAPPPNHTFGAPSRLPRTGMRKLPTQLNPSINSLSLTTSYPAMVRQYGAELASEQEKQWRHHAAEQDRLWRDHAAEQERLWRDHADEQERLWREQATKHATEQEKLWREHTVDVTNTQNALLRETLANVKLEYLQWQDEVKKGMKEDLTKIYAKLPWPPLPEDNYPRAIRCFAETFLARKGYKGKNLKTFLSNLDPEDRDLIGLLYNDNIHKGVHNASAAEVAEAMLGTRKRYNDDQWELANHWFYRKAKVSMEEAIERGLGRDSADEKYRFGSQFHAEGNEAPDSF